MSHPSELSLEQKFNIRSFEVQVQNMSHQQAQEFLVKLYEQMLLRDNMYQEVLKHQWGLDAPPQM
ncbi:MAG: NblA/ycf18 family protein [Pleurocapsa sp.]